MYGLLRRIAGLGLVVVAAGGVAGAAPAPREVVAPVAVPRAAPVARPVPAPVDPARAIVYQRGYEPGSGRRVLVERWVMAGTAFRERVTVDGKPLTDRSDGREVDYSRGVWRLGTGRGLDGDCARTPTELEAGLVNGSVTVSGPGVAIGGAPTTVVRHHGPPVVDVWVSALTRRAVRCQVAEPGAVPFDLVWLPATAANLAQLVAVIPDGFVTDSTQAVT